MDGATVYGGFAGISAPGGGVWLTPLSGAAGTITISTLTTTRIAGTFAFAANASSGGATGTRTVTNGVFDAPLSGNAVLPALTDSMGGKMTSSLNGQAWNASAVAPAGPRCCYGIAGDVGTITFTSLTVTRAQGTFSATLRAQPGTAATGQLVISGGTFDVGLYHNP